MSSRSTQIIGGPDREHAWVDTTTNALLVKVVNPGSGTGTDVNIASVGGTSIGTTVPVSQATHDNLNVNANLQVGDADVSALNPVPISGTFSATFGGLVSPGNATTTPLGSGATFTGAWEDVKDYATLTIQAYADVASATGGWKLQWSVDGTNADKEESLTLAAGSRALAMNVRSRYFRTVYTNGGTAQTTFRLGTVYRPSGNGMNNYTLSTTLSDTTLAVMTRSVIVGETTGGGGGYHNVKVTPSGALTVEVDDGGGSLTVDQATHDNLNANVNLQVGDVDVGSGNPVPISDAGGSITVDGTVAVSSIAGSVTIAEPVSVDDNGGSLTVDDGGLSLTVDGTVAVSGVSGSVTVAQATHDNLNANVNLQVGDVDVGSGNPVPISDAGGSITVDGTVAVSSIAGSVTIAEPVSVDDNGGSLTVDGTVAVSSVGGTVTVADGGGSLTVDGTVGVSGTVTVADGGGSLTVDGTVAVSSVSGNVTVVDGGGSLTIDGSVSITGTVDTGLGKAEDTAHVSGDTGVMALAIRRDTPSSPSGTNGDYTPLSVDARGCLRVVIADGEDAAPMSSFLQTDSVSLSATAPALSLLASAPKGYDSTTYTTDETYFARMDNAGNLQVSGIIRDADTPGSAALNVVRIDDFAGTTAWTGILGVTKRVDAPSAAASSANGDFQGLVSDAQGRLWVDAVQSGTWTVDVNDGQLNAVLYVGASPVDSTNPVYVREAGVTTIALSGSVRGRPIQIAATTSPGTTLHTATTTTGQLDRVYIYLTNTSASAVLVTIEFGTTGGSSEMDLIVPANDTVVAVDGAVLGGGATDTITAYAATGSVINAFGRIERLA